MSRIDKIIGESSITESGFGPIATDDEAKKANDILRKHGWRSQFVKRGDSFVFDYRDTKDYARVGYTPGIGFIFLPGMNTNWMGMPNAKEYVAHVNEAWKCLLDLQNVNKDWVTD